VGIDKTHPAGSRATVTFKRGDQTLGLMILMMTVPGSIPVTPGTVQTFVDGEPGGTMTVTQGAASYIRTGTGCAAELSP